jgi:hypothetical protein
LAIAETKALRFSGTPLQASKSLLAALMGRDPFADFDRRIDTARGNAIESSRNFDSAQILPAAKAANLLLEACYPELRVPRLPIAWE